jgi:CTP synthase
LYVHVTLVPHIKTADELKTKPTQHSVKELREIGIQPDILLCRTEKELSKEIKAKIALFCNLAPEAVIMAMDVDTIYKVPLAFHEEGLDDIIVNYLGLKTREADLSVWKKIVEQASQTNATVTIGIVGKYIELRESYKSLYEALAHGGMANHTKVEIKWIDAEDVEQKKEGILEGVDGILVPGGFGSRGIEGKISAVKHARDEKIPFFGICLGMHCAIIEFARNVCGISDANSSEIDAETKNPVVDFLPNQNIQKDKGGTMRLGAWRCQLRKETNAYNAYGEREISERHRHRYEFNNKYRLQFEEAGLRFSGLSPDGNLVEIIEVKDHPWFLAGQFHPEFKSKPNLPHPLFRDFIKAALAYNSNNCVKF